MSVIDCDYLPADKAVFPPELALLIVRKASAMAAAFEEQALDQLTKDARRALSQGTEPKRVIREMRLWAEKGNCRDLGNCSSTCHTGMGAQANLG